MARYHYSVQILPLRITVSTHGFGPCGGSSILSEVTNYMVIVAELVKRLIVVQEIVGSSPIFHT